MEYDNSAFLNFIEPEKFVPQPKNFQCSFLKIDENFSTVAYQTVPYGTILSVGRNLKQELWNVAQSAEMILTQTNYRGQNSFRIHIWDANGVFWREKESSVQQTPLHKFFKN